MEISKEKQNLVMKLQNFRRRLQVKLDRDIQIQDLAKMTGFSSPQLSRWHNTSTNVMPGGESAIRLVNFYIEWFGQEALEIYDALGWERPKSPD